MAKGKKPAGEKKPRTKKSDAPERIVADQLKVPPPKKLNALLATCRSGYKEGRAIAGEMGAAIKILADEENLNKKAFAMVRSLDRLEPEALKDVLDHFKSYCNTTGLTKRAESVLRMNLEAGTGAVTTGETEDAGERTGNVRPFPQSSQAAE